MSKYQLVERISMRQRSRRIRRMMLLPFAFSFIIVFLLLFIPIAIIEDLLKRIDIYTNDVSNFLETLFCVPADWAIGVVTSDFEKDKNFFLSLYKK